MKSALIVEDYKQIAEIWNITMLQENYRIIEHIENTDFVEQAIIDIHPDIILMDISLPGALNGMEMAEKILLANPNQKLIFLTLHSELSILKKAMLIGAKGFVVKNSPLAEFRIAIKSIENGGTYICKQMLPFVA
jgi:DNA-binding NarL/FixJ family response regulator